MLFMCNVISFLSLRCRICVVAIDASEDEGRPERVESPDSSQSVEHQTFNLRVQGSSPCSGGTFLHTFY